MSLALKSPRIAGFLLLALAVPAAHGNLPEARKWQFKVLLDEREIGFHEFTVSGPEQARSVRSEARFDVRLLFVNVYRYRHRTLERWDENCLSGIESTTLENDKRFMVQGDQAADGFRIAAGSTETRLPACVMTFAYWNPAFLKRTRLLNAQTGSYEPVAVEPLGADVVSVNDKRIPAQRYRVVVGETPITLWYATADDRWLALETVAKGGRTLRYEPVAIPPPRRDVSARLGPEPAEEQA